MGTSGSYLIWVFFGLAAVEVLVVFAAGGEDDDACASLTFRTDEQVMGSTQTLLDGGGSSAPVVVALELRDCCIIWRRRLRATVPIDGDSGVVVVFIIEVCDCISCKSGGGGGQEEFLFLTV